MKWGVMGMGGSSTSVFPSSKQSLQNRNFFACNRNYSWFLFSSLFYFSWIPSILLLLSVFSLSVSVPSSSSVIFVEGWEFSVLSDHFYSFPKLLYLCSFAFFNINSRYTCKSGLVTSVSLVCSDLFGAI